MTEIFDQIRDEVKNTAEFAWRVAMALKNPVESAKFLNNVTNYFKSSSTEEEIDFLRFYFNMKMEMMKE